MDSNLGSEKQGIIISKNLDNNKISKFDRSQTAKITAEQEATNGKAKQVKINADLPP